MPGPLRAALEKHSYRMLLYFNSLPRAVPFAVVGGLLIAGLVTSGVLSFVALLLVGLFLGWLALLSWPLVSPGGRLLRVACTLVVLAAAVERLL